jgi:hypothetical protein
MGVFKKIGAPHRPRTSPMQGDTLKKFRKDFGAWPVLTNVAMARRCPLIGG